MIPENSSTDPEIIISLAIREAANSTQSHHQSNTKNYSGNEQEWERDSD